MTGVRFEPKVERIRNDIMKFAEFVSPGEPPYTRISFSPEDREARAYVRLLMEGAHLQVRTDAAGNIVGRRKGAEGLAPIVIGSHLDTVRGGGRFDGVAGVVAALEVARRTEELRVELAHPLEVVVFLAEEPSPFGISTIGSRAMAGKLTGEHLAITDKTGRSLGEALREVGGDPDRLPEAIRSTGGICAFLELHIEQGPHLESAGVPLGVVTGIVGIWRGHIEVKGQPDHAGTTPMGRRRDALAAGSDIVLALERVCAAAGDMVGTVGRVEVFPNALNVIPGRMVLGMEMRGLTIDRIEAAARQFTDRLDRIRDERGVDISFDFSMTSSPVHFPEEVLAVVRGTAQRLQIPYVELQSGAGHDANHLAGIAPGAMIFVPSKDGRSHCSDEWTDFDDIRIGCEVLAAALVELDRRQKA
jgi:N-carbamoyl-L-amino-acid hydrolase